MRLASLDWLVIGLFFALYLGIGFGVARRAGRSFGSFFLGGRTMPWWLLGFSMVATTFATDTPNLVTQIVRTSAVFGNWQWWAFLLSGLVTVFFFAKLWRRSGVLTDIEFNELRYSGRPAAALRGFRAIYLGVIFNTIVMANVTLAAIKIGAVMLGLSPLQTILIAATITALYSSAGGLTGVVITDLIQFTVAMGGALAAAFYLVGLPEVGGWSSLIARPEVQSLLPVLPTFSTVPWDVLAAVFLMPLAIQWWATYYPGSEPGGGGYVVQRVLAARNERHAAGAALLFNLLHYAVRPWPWIVIALASLAVFPNLDAIQERFPTLNPAILGHDLAYPAMLTFLPAGLLGIVVASLIAAYMSTMSTQLNWGSSILVNDLYRRFLRPQASEHDLVRTGRAATAALMLLACLVALYLDSALQSFQLLLQIGAGTGLLFALRWFWWRINALTEIVAMIVSFLVAVVLHVGHGFGLGAASQLLLGVAITTVAWVAAAFLTPPTDESRLRAFYRQVQPGGPGWSAVLHRARRDGTALETPGHTPDFALALIGTLSGLAAIWGLLFTLGALLYGQTGALIGCGLLTAAGAAGLVWVWPRLSFR
ncbi:MAG: Na+:solute symporter [Verrucomicrobiae bacterium]|nr:Na+:solute symporter [Verrucomicrobiae bacterium]